MPNYIPTKSEVRTAVVTTVVLLLVVTLGGALMRGIGYAAHGAMGGGSYRIMDKKGKMDDMMGGNMKGMGSMQGTSHDMSADEDMMDMTMHDMVGMMDGKTGKALEKEFIVGMIPHHQGAVDMAKKLLEDSTISAEMKKFAEDIIRAQEGEISMMQGWLGNY